jgi:hypothetical protein
MSIWARLDLDLPPGFFEVEAQHAVHHFAGELFVASRLHERLALRPKQALQRLLVGEHRQRGTTCW